MLKYLLFPVLISGTVGLMVGAPEQVRAAVACAAVPQQKAMVVAGTVIQMGKEPPLPQRRCPGRQVIHHDDFRSARQPDDPPKRNPGF